jgi:ABC-type sugar transport system substrate-binding protein
MVLAGILSAGCVMGCASSSGAKEPAVGSASLSGGKQPIITVMTNAIGGELQHMLQAGAILQGQEMGYTVNILAPTNATNVQEVVNNFAEAQTYSDAIVFMSNDSAVERNEDYWEQVAPALSDAKSTGIPIVAMYYGGEDEGSVDAYVTSNSYRMGRAIGECIMENQPNAVVGIVQTSANNKMRKMQEKGLTEVVQENGGTVLQDEAISNWNWDSAKTLTASLLQNHPEMTTIFCASDWLAVGVAETVQEAARQDSTENTAADEGDGTTAQAVQVYASGPLTGGLSSVVSGAIKADVIEQPVQIGREAIVLADALLNGQTVEQTNRVPYLLATQENAQALLDQLTADLEAAGVTG